MNTAKKMLLGVSLAGFILCLAIAPAAAATLWYNGDYDLSGIATVNATNMDPVISPSATYDDFIVPSGGWHITTVWSNNLMDTTGITQASWEIRSGVSNGNGGTLVASGTDTATQTVTGVYDPAYHYYEYKIQVSGLNVNLVPGTYWLSVSPYGSGTGNSYITVTGGANAVGQPPGTDGNSFFNCTMYGANFDDASNWVGISPADFSMGVGGDPVPVPATVWLLGSGLVGLIGFGRKLTKR